ncbi:MAG: 30S ribosomal protein S17e [Nitrososphaeria archaeon]|nr:30S ribosomal protein S17e [Nitrososphaeria archaeon]MDW8021073.1 30S ribosomal protein S17e [Nitrososphaerota archaeon]
MGRIKTRKVKVLAKEIFEKYPDRVSTDFELNKRFVGELLVGQASKKLRNQVAGYITRLMGMKLKGAEEAEAA